MLITLVSQTTKIDITSFLGGGGGSLYFHLRVRLKKCFLASILLNQEGNKCLDLKVRTFEDRQKYFDIGKVFYVIFI